MMKAFAVSLRPENTLLMVRKSSARPSEICAIIANPSIPVVLSEMTLTSACIKVLLVTFSVSLVCESTWMGQS